MANKSTNARPVSGVSMLTVNGEIQVSEAFFQHLDERIRESVNDALGDILDQLKKQLPASAAPEPTNMSGGGLELMPGEPERARNARRGPLGLKLSEGQGLIDGKALAVFLDISYRALYTLMAQGAVPEPTTLGGRMKRWSVEEVLAWVMSGCPRAEHWKRKRVQAIRDYRALSSTRDHRRG